MAGSAAHQAVDDAAQEIERLRKFLKKKKTVQVQAAEETSVIKATCLAWFNAHRTSAREGIGDELLEPADEIYKELLSASGRAVSRLRYDKLLKELSRTLTELAVSAVAPSLPPPSTGDEIPSFDPLVPDAQMRAVLQRRWLECSTCVRAGAPLAATVMMGGLLETLLLARVHTAPSKTSVFAAKGAPSDRKTGKTLPLNEWTLRHYIDVAHELQWISASAKDLGVVLRDYRNYVHPHKELTHGVILSAEDALLLWQVAKAIARQLLRDAIV
jgi:hypothetical protein